MDTLPDLRVTIAESMEALASTTLDYAKMWSMHYGAKTLRWCAEREAPSYEEMELERDTAQAALEEAQDNIENLVDNVKYAVSKWLHAENCARLAAKSDIECACGMEKMRQSVLDAVA